MTLKIPLGIIFFSVISEPDFNNLIMSRQESTSINGNSEAQNHIYNVNSELIKVYNVLLKLDMLPWLFYLFCAERSVVVDVVRCICLCQTSQKHHKRFQVAVL